MHQPQSSCARSRGNARIPTAYSRLELLLFDAMRPGIKPGMRGALLLAALLLGSASSPLPPDVDRFQPSGPSWANASAWRGSVVSPHGREGLSTAAVHPTGPPLPTVLGASSNLSACSHAFSKQALQLVRANDVHYIMAQTGHPHW